VILLITYLTLIFMFVIIDNMKKEFSKESELSNTKLKYEKIKDKKKESLIKKIKRNITNKISKIKPALKNIIKKAKHKSKKPKKVTKIGQELAKKERNNVIMGICLLLVVVSIIYSTAVIFLGVDSQASKIALLPQVTFALIILIKAFSKLYK